MKSIYRIIKRLLPLSVKQFFKDILSITALERRLEEIETLIHISKDDLSEHAKLRWRNAEPDTKLTWQQELSGDNFIAKAIEYGVFGSEKNVLEIGPGYGRLLSASMGKNIPFASYTGLDISSKNVAKLREKFPFAHFEHGDVEKFRFPRHYDSVISSLVFKHIYPTFQKAMTNISSSLSEGAVVTIDLIEGNTKHFVSGPDKRHDTYIAEYQREEIEKILQVAGLEFSCFDEVYHAHGHRRLLFVARKPLSSH